MTPPKPLICTERKKTGVFFISEDDERVEERMKELIRRYNPPETKTSRARAGKGTNIKRKRLDPRVNDAGEVKESGGNEESHLTRDREESVGQKNIEKSDDEKQLEKLIQLRETLLEKMKDGDDAGDVPAKIQLPQQQMSFDCALSFLHYLAKTPAKFNPSLISDNFEEVKESGRKEESNGKEESHLPRDREESVGQKNIEKSDDEKLIEKLIQLRKTLVEEIKDGDDAGEVKESGGNEESHLTRDREESVGQKNIEKSVVVKLIEKLIQLGKTLVEKIKDGDDAGEVKESGGNEESHLTRDREESVGLKNIEKSDDEKLIEKLIQLRKTLVEEIKDGDDAGEVKESGGNEESHLTRDREESVGQKNIEKSDDEKLLEKLIQLRETLLEKMKDGDDAGDVPAKIQLPQQQMSFDCALSFLHYLAKTPAKFNPSLISDNFEEVKESGRKEESSGKEESKFLHNPAPS